MRQSHRVPIPLLLCVKLFLLFAAFLAVRSFANLRFSEEVLIYDLIWLDAWALAFVAVLVAAWYSPVSKTVRARIMVGATSLWGAITMMLIFHGAPYGMNAYFGDQAFRIAMILKFKTFVFAGDYYYKDLPAFYPPVLYWLLGIGAKILGANAFLMVKVGSILIYLVSPLLLYWLWRKLVTPLQAAMIALMTILFVSFDKSAPLLAPHAFLANSLFIPWWFAFVEQVRRPHQTDWRYYLIGGLIGGALFATYYYPFFIGALLLLIRLIGQLFKRNWAVAPRQSCWSRVWLMLIAAAVAASPYWLPQLWSFLTVGYDTGPGWHHIGSTGIGFRFLQFSLTGLAFLGALLYAVRRIRQPLYRGFVWLVGIVLLFHLVGSILGALDKPVNLIKAGEFIALAGGSLIGLVAAAWLQSRRLSPRIARVRAALVLALVIVMLHQTNGIAKHDMVRTARTTGIPTWGMDARNVNERAGRVFLTSHEKLPAFYPVYSFYAINQHYSHPAGRLTERLALLDALQSIRDPYIFNLALRTNRYDAVDYFMPRIVDNRYEFIVALSNYPNRYRHVYYHFDPAVTADTTLFRPETGDLLFAVVAPEVLPTAVRIPESAAILQDIGAHLTDQGRAELARYLGQ